MKAGLVGLLASLEQWTTTINGQNTSTVVPCLFRDSIPNDAGTANIIRLRALRSRSCTRWLFPAPMLLVGFSRQNKVSYRAFPPFHHHPLALCWKLPGPVFPSPQGASERNGTELLSVSGIGLPLAHFITFLVSNLYSSCVQIGSFHFNV